MVNGGFDEVIYICKYNSIPMCISVLHHKPETPAIKEIKFEPDSEATRLKAKTNKNFSHKTKVSFRPKECKKEKKKKERNTVIDLQQSVKDNSEQTFAAICKYSTFSGQGRE